MNLLKSPSDINGGPKLFKLGTLSYTQKGLVMLFFWLMWNDFCLTLFENVQQFIGILFRDNKASFYVMGLSGSITSIVCLLISPAISTLSDRYRSKYGRRRPFLLAATPPLALIVMAIPYMPDLGHYLSRYPSLVAFWDHLGINGPVFCIAIGVIIFSLFNYIITSLFIYYWWDVVPEEVLGRFNGLNQIVGKGAQLFFLCFLFGYGEFHLKQLTFCMGLFFLVFYMVSTWRVKEGEYPPPEPRQPGNKFWVIVKTYFQDCYTKPRYLWIFGALTIYQLGNLGNNYQFYYLHYDLRLSLDTYGKFSSFPTILLFIGGYALGSLTDKFKPIRLMAPTLLVWSATYIISYYFVRDKWTFLIFNTLNQLPVFTLNILFGALAVEVYPREKLGQFCSAASMVQVFMGCLFNPFLGLVFDHLKNNRIGYLWSAGFQVVAALCFFRIYHNWKRLHPDQLLPGENPEPA